MGQCILMRNSSGNSGVPEPVTSFTAIGREKSILLKWTLPENKDNYAGATIVYNTTAMPTSVTDGTAVNVDATATTATISGLAVNTTYYFRIFPFGPTGKYNESLTGSFDSGKTAPTKKTSFSFKEVITSSVTKSMASGWYRVICVGKSGDGGDGGDCTSTSSSCGGGGGGGGGGTGGIAVSVVYIDAKEWVKLTVTASLTSFSASGNALTASAGKSGGNGKDSASRTSAAGGTAGTAGNASGGNLHNQTGAAGKAGAESGSGSDNGYGGLGAAGGQFKTITNTYYSKYLASYDTDDYRGTCYGDTADELSATDFPDLMSTGTPKLYGGGCGGGGAYGWLASLTYGGNGSNGSPACIIIES